MKCEEPFSLPGPTTIGDYTGAESQQYWRAREAKTTFIDVATRQHISVYIQHEATSLELCTCTLQLQLLRRRNLVSATKTCSAGICPLLTNSWVIQRQAQAARGPRHENMWQPYSDQVGLQVDTDIDNAPGLPTQRVPRVLKHGLLRSPGVAPGVFLSLSRRSMASTKSRG